jgi:hypothetical protein
MRAPRELEAEDPGAVRAHPPERRKLGHTRREHQSGAKPKQTSAVDTIEAIGKGSTGILSGGSESHDTG